jgi:hypothetical protein
VLCQSLVPLLVPLPKLVSVADVYSHDVFISHASEDKARFVRPLVEALRATQMNVWYDEWELEVGDRLVERINDGPARSRLGAVVLSPAFLQARRGRKPKT